MSGYLLDQALIKDIIKDAGEQPDEKTHRARSGRVLSMGASVPMEVGAHPPPQHMDASPRQTVIKSCSIVFIVVSLQTLSSQRPVVEAEHCNTVTTQLLWDQRIQGHGGVPF